MSALISILLPSYNHARFLPFCIRSVLAQTCEDWEIIAVDDCSQDDSLATLRSFEDPRIKVHPNDSNLGTYGTLNRALSLAYGEFIAVLNSDDAWAPTKLARQLESINAKPKAPLVYTAGQRIDQNDQTIEDAFLANQKDLLPALLEKNDVLASSVLFRRPYAKFHSELRYSGDWIALLEAARTEPPAVVNESLTFWRMHDNNTFRRSPAQVQEEILVRESILNQPEAWQMPRLNPKKVRRSLSACARHLSALYILQGRPKEARRAARIAVKYDPDAKSIRRLAVVSLPLSRAKQQLWPGETQIAELPPLPLLSFPSPSP